MGIQMRMLHGMKLAAVLAVALTVGACANKDNQVGGAGGAAVPGSQQDFVVNVGDRVFFETDSPELTPQARATLDSQVQWLQRYSQYTFTLEGHADERGTREYNFSLSARRAQTVRDYLASRGIQGNRMRIVSYGKERPVAVCNDISCWSQNRRSVTVLDGAGGAATPGSAQDFVVNVGDRVFFETDSTDLTPTAVSTLDKQSAWLQRYPRYTFVVEGHADERGTREYNFSLSARRAQTVREYLASRGINPQRMRTISYGKERPVAVCDDISCWSQNRRVVTVLNASS